MTEKLSAISIQLLAFLIGHCLLPVLSAVDPSTQPFSSELRAELLRVDAEEGRSIEGLTF
jgi:hypothetical protein